MKKISSILFCVVLFFSCARKFSITSTFSKGIPQGMQQLVLDSSYHLYIREVFLDTNDAGDKMVLINNDNAASNNKLIEIEYLLLSTQQNKVVYIATIPDKYQTYYAKKAKFLKREYLNAYDFSTFHFGRKTAGEHSIVFENNSTGHSDTWHYRIEKDSILHVYEVVERRKGDVANVYLADEALSRKASFIRTDSFRIAFRNMDKEKRVETKKGRAPLQRFSKDNIIYYRNDGNKYTIYFRFNKTLPPKYKDSTISFGNTRIVNAPF
jgi:hypothetical protein